LCLPNSFETLLSSPETLRRFHPDFSPPGFANWRLKSLLPSPPFRGQCPGFSPSLRLMSFLTHGIFHQKHFGCVTIPPRLGTYPDTTYPFATSVCPSPFPDSFRPRVCGWSLFPCWFLIGFFLLASKIAKICRSPDFTVD